MSENKGNPYHAEDGKFTSKNGGSSSSPQERLDSKQSNPFSKNEMPGFEGMSDKWNDLFSVAQKIIDRGKAKKNESPETEKPLDEDHKIINEAVKKLQDWAGIHEEPSKRWGEDMYYTFKSMGLSDEESSRLTSIFTKEAKTDEEVHSQHKEKTAEDKVREMGFDGEEE